jgi:VanZ family protein
LKLVASWRLAFVSALALVLFVALRPVAPAPDWFEHADKLRHATAFVVLWELGRRSGLKPAWALAAGLLSFGIGIEWAQSFVPSREASLGDVAADGAGIVSGLLVQSLRRGAATPPAT